MTNASSPEPTPTPSAPWLLRSGVGRVVRFNWPKYVAAFGALILLAALVASFDGLPRLLLILAILGLCYGILGSLTATWWVYDHRSDQLLVELSRRHDHKRAWVLVHAGFDESRGRLDNLLGTPVATLDVGPQMHLSRSLERAVGLMGRPDRPAILGPETNIATAIVLFGIHELRKPGEPEALLRQLGGSLASVGRVLIVEHLRDVPNTLVYGPAVLHFGSKKRWSDAVHNAGLKVASTTRVAGFITVIEAVASV
jgi:hypothetical protein